MTLAVLESPSTTQKALLERFLARQRTQRILPYTRGKRVLDFGCGLQAWNANQIRPYCHEVIGVEPNFASPSRVGLVNVYPSLDPLPRSYFDVVVALAVFEHIEPNHLISLLGLLTEYCGSNARIVGTVPTPQARPILEFLSFRLHLIDPSQIADHKVYYDDLWLAYIVNQTAWEIEAYARFQLGCNGQFVLRRKQ